MMALRLSNLAIVAAVTILLFMMPAPKPVFAAPPSIDPSSCGLAGAAWIGPNSYCSFETTEGADIVIGPNSCNLLNSCLHLGDGASINAGGPPLAFGSCNGFDACTGAGFSGSIFIGARACNGEGACQVAGNGGMTSVDDGACNGATACFAAGVDGFASIGVGACSGEDACLGVADQGEFTVGARSCNDFRACFRAGDHGSVEIGSNSCNYWEACSGAGSDDFGPPSIGSFSCNQFEIYDAQCTDLLMTQDTPPVGNCEFNDPRLIAAPASLPLGICLFLNTPLYSLMESGLEGLLDTVLPWVPPLLPGSPGFPGN